MNHCHSLRVFLCYAYNFEYNIHNDHRDLRTGNFEDEGAKMLSRLLDMPEFSDAGYNTSTYSWNGPGTIYGDAPTGHRNEGEALARFALAGGGRREGKGYR